ncbi:hypothetical protein SMC26_40775 [Actinomadura fulvescens]|uniref:Twin-arginine translocation signal domain-containing protein n=1 Tax=Actinomadura fulvescens TaxID=46160 RepID=A0ABN3QZN7_9ACTN
MKLALSNIPTLDSAPQDAVPAGRRFAHDPQAWGRRGVLRSAVAIGTGLGISTLGLFPFAREASAARDGYQILNRCPSYAGKHNCSPGCGPSPSCYDCCRFTGRTTCTRPGWFKVQRNKYKLRKNDCVRGKGWDGWNWRYDKRCGCCRSNVTYRCHDGYKRIRGSWKPRICRTVIACNCPFC